jgi:hypothetical protein
LTFWIKQMQKFRLSAFVALVTPVLGFTQSQAAYPNRIHIEAVMKEQQRSNIYDRLHPGDVFMQIRRKGTAYGSGLLNRAKIVETAEFLVAPSVSTAVSGELFLSKGQSQCHFHWTEMPRTSKDDQSASNEMDVGTWKLVSGSGLFSHLIGNGTLTIAIKSYDERLITLDGKLNDGGVKPE